MSTVVVRVRLNRTAFGLVIRGKLIRIAIHGDLLTAGDARGISSVCEEKKSEKVKGRKEKKQELIRCRLWIRGRMGRPRVAESNGGNGN